MTHFYRCKNNPKRLTLYGRHCRILAKSKRLNSLLIEFENGQREIVSLNAVRRIPRGR